MAYPTALDNLSTLTGSESMTTHASLHNEERDAIDALQAKVGVDSSAVATSLDYLVKNTSSSNPGHKHTLANGATDVTKTVTQVNAILGTEHNNDGTHTETALDSMIAGTEATGDIIYHNGTIWTRLPIGSTGQALVVSSGSPAWGASGAFWKDVPGTPTRVSDTQFTITDTSNANLYDVLFKKGVVLKWLESSTFQTAMCISASYSSNTVTVNIVGDSLTAGFTSMQYAASEALQETFIIPGTIATGTDLAKTFYAPEQIYVISADAYHKTAGTTNSTVYDINDDGSTLFTTKPTITTGTTSDIDNVSTNPSTAVAKDSLITIDVDSVSTTAPVEAYIKLFYYPVSWRYR